MLALSLLTLAFGAHAFATANPNASAQELYGSLPLAFEPNQGQTDPRVGYMARGNGYSVFLTGTEAVLSLRLPVAPLVLRNPFDMPAVLQELERLENTSAVLRMEFLGANPDPVAEGLGPMPGHSNYFVGNDPSRWRTGVPQYAQVLYREVYPGVDLLYYGKEQSLEYDFIVGAGTDPNVIQLEFKGNDTMRIDENGDLVLGAVGDEVRFKKPFIYQEREGERQKIAGSYVLDRNRVSFEVEEYDRSRPLVIDPVLVFSTLLGGSGHEFGLAVNVDEAGRIYVAGETTSTNFPTMDPLQPANAGHSDAFLSVLDETGSFLLYSTYMGGSHNDLFLGTTLDAAGNIYVSGWTHSEDFPTMNPIQMTNGGFWDACVAKIEPTGANLLFSTYIGGEGDELSRGLAVDETGHIYVTGWTESSDFPVENAFQPVFGGGQNDAFVAKIDPFQPAYVYSTFMGGSSSDLGFNLAIDDELNVYFNGWTVSPDFPVMNPIQIGGTSWDAFVTKLNREGDGLVYSTYFGGSHNDLSIGLALGSGREVYIAGWTFSTDFPTVNAAQPTYGGNGDGFVTKINAAGSEVVYSTFVGGSDYEEGWGIGVDSFGKAYVSGWTFSEDFPTVNPIQSEYGGGDGDTYVTKLTRSGSSFVYSTYLGGAGEDFPVFTIADDRGNAYVAGWSTSVDFPTTLGAFQFSNAGGYDAYLVKIQSDGADVAVTKNDNPDPVGVGEVLTYDILVTNYGPEEATSVVLVDRLPKKTKFLEVITERGTCSYSHSEHRVRCELGDLEAGEDVLVEVIVKARKPGPVRNVAGVTAEEFDPDETNNRAVETTQIKRVADLVVKKYVCPKEARFGKTLLYKLAVKNKGPSMATGVVLADSLPSDIDVRWVWTSKGRCNLSDGELGCRLGRMYPGQWAFVLVAVRPKKEGTYVNSVHVDGNSLDRNTDNNTDSVTTEVKAKPKRPRKDRKGWHHSGK